MLVIYNWPKFYNWRERWLKLKFKAWDKDNSEMGCLNAELEKEPKNIYINNQMVKSNFWL